jgi:hypothetical protein
MKSHAPSSERLEQATTIIAQHANYPGKQEGYRPDCCKNIL